MPLYNHHRRHQNRKKGHIIFRDAIDKKRLTGDTNINEEYSPVLSKRPAQVR